MRIKMAKRKSTANERSTYQIEEFGSLNDKRWWLRSHGGAVFFLAWRPGLKSKVDTRSIESEITLAFSATVKVNSRGSSRREHICSRKDPGYDRWIKNGPIRGRSIVTSCFLIEIFKDWPMKTIGENWKSKRCWEMIMIWRVEECMEFVESLYVNIYGMQVACRLNSFVT